MSNHNKPGGKSGQRGRKPDQQRGQKPAPPQSPEPAPMQAEKPEPLLNRAPEPLQNGDEPIDEKVVSTDAFPVAPANTPAIDFQTIATAYSDYSKKSFEQTKAFVEKLAGVRSLDKAIEIQTEFAKQAYETFVTESQKIRGLYSGLARQTFKPLEGLLPR
jgi:Phasin protein